MNRRLLIVLVAAVCSICMFMASAQASLTFDVTIDTNGTDFTGGYGGPDSFKKPLAPWFSTNIQATRNNYFMTLSATDGAFGSNGWGDEREFYYWFNPDCKFTLSTNYGKIVRIEFECFACNGTITASSGQWTESQTGNQGEWVGSAASVSFTVSEYSAVDGRFTVYFDFGEIPPLAGADVNRDGKVDPDDLGYLYDMLFGFFEYDTRSDLDGDDNFYLYSDGQLLQNYLIYLMDATPYRGLGDVNGDGTIDTTDLYQIGNNLNYHNYSVDNPAKDINGDGLVNAWDYIILAKIIQNGWFDPNDTPGGTGDINSDSKVDPDDWNLMWDFIKGKRTPTAGEKTAADLNNDGTINATDAALLENLVKTAFDQDVADYRGRGDVDGNGKLNAADANIIKGIAQERGNTVPSGQPLADVNGDGKVDGWDYFILLKVIANGWIEPYDLDDDGAVNPHDWDLLIDFVQQWQTPDVAQAFIADYNRDGELDMTDTDRLRDIILQKYPFDVNRYRGAGDVDGNGRINQTDAKIIKAIVLGTKQFSDYPKADVDRNGMVNGMDYFIVLLMVQNGWTELYGDVNGDGKVDPDDWNLILAIMSGDYQGPIDIFRADIDGNGTVDMSDLYALEFQIINNHPIDVARYRGRGDVDGNGVIEVADYNLISGYALAYDKNQYVQRHPDFDLDRADVNLDGNIDGWDYFIVRFLILNGWTDPNDTPGTPGDVDGNGSVGIEDVNAVINIMLGKAENAVADVSGNGSVGIEDVNAIINLMLGK